MSGFFLFNSLIFARFFSKKQHQQISISTHFIQYVYLLNDQKRDFKNSTNSEYILVKPIR